MLGSMKRDEIKQSLNRLRTEVDPKFQSEIGNIADSLESLLGGASKGGTARAKKLTKKRRKEIATSAAEARWAKK